MANEDVVDVPAADIPLQEGYVGNLTDEQHSALVRMWESYFDICDRARGNASKGQGFVESKEGKDLKKSGIPDDDAAKDEAKRMQEQQGMNELMDTYGSEALHDSFWNFVRGDSPDGGMLKFIRARKGDVQRAISMMATCLKWRLDTDVESFILNGDLTNSKDIPKFIEQQKSGKVFSLGCTAKEQPICYVIMKYHSVFGQPAASMQKFIVTQMETFRLLMHPPNDKATIFFDLKGFGIKQMDFVNLLYLVKVLESYYPESLGTMYISNAPLIFWGFWRAVKNLLDPVVRNKIVFIASPEDTQGDVPEDCMIEYCGGKVQNEFDFVDPREGENDAQHDTETKEALLKRHRALTDKFEEVTRAWCKAEGKDEKLQEERDVLCKKIRLSQFELEPYTRGLTVYHRNGVLPPENMGISVFDYTVPNKPTRRQVLGRRSCRKSLERELFYIVKEGKTVKQAQEKIESDLKDGSWGQWRVNDNSEEVKKVALASLTDADNTKNLQTDNVDVQGTNNVHVAAVPQNVVNEHREAAQQEGMQQSQPQQNGTADHKDDDHKGVNGEAVAAGGAGAAAVGAGAGAAGIAKHQETSATENQNEASPQNGQASRASGREVEQANVNANKLDNDAPRPRGNSASQGPSSNGPTNYAKQESPSVNRRSSLFGSIKSKLGKSAA